MNSNLNKFIEAQESDYESALSEIKSGRKKSHWMWYIFPQFKGLGFSATAQHFSINSLEEAKEYLKHPLLGKRLKEITKALLDLDENDPLVIFGSPDDKKLKSSMTLFSVIENRDDNLFQSVLAKFFNGEVDRRTLKLLEEHR